ncbi:MAG: FkbM family methyltransferase, partial [Acidimicrobiia bacterium]
MLRWGVVVRRTMPGTTVRCYWKITSRQDVFRVASAWVKEPGTIAWIRDEVRQGDVVWDIGANIGIYTVPLGHKVRGVGGRVVAVEPNLVNTVSLLTNLLLNDLGEVVSVVAEPMADSSSFGEMFMRSAHLQSGRSGVQFSHVGTMGSPSDTERRGVTRHVRAVSADDLCAAVGSPPHIVK